MTAKPCPWCGRRQYVLEFTESHTAPMVRMKCGHCDLLGPWGSNEGEALAYWNTRPLEDELIAACERTLEALDSMVVSASVVVSLRAATANVKGESL